MVNVIELKDVSFSYLKTSDFAIKRINLKIKEGQFIVVIGPNGSGKTTLAKLLNGQISPTEGLVLVDKKATKGLDEGIWEVKKKVGIVLQNSENQIVANTVEDDIAFGLENQGIDPKEIRIKVNQALTDVDIMSLRLLDPQNLSGGQKKKVAIAGILAMRPKVIILDEATSMLDPKGKKEIIKLVRELCDKEKITIINITNVIQEGLISDRVIVMNDGEILLDDTPENVFCHNRDLLIDIGLELPVSIEIANRLINRGYQIKRGLDKEEELIESIWRLFLTK